MAQDTEVRGTGTRRVLGGVALGVVAAVVGTAVWYLVHGGPVVLVVLVTLGVGALIGAAVSWGAGGRSGFVLAAVAALLVVGAHVVSANVTQRDALQDGIDRLQARWQDLRVDPQAEAAAAESDAVAAAEAARRPPGDAVIPPPEVVPRIPLPGLMMMTPQVMATVWQYITPEQRAQLPPERVAEVEALLAPPDPGDAGAVAAAEALAQARADLETDEAYDVPRPVLECAPPPDLTAPDAAAGLGFPDGVPLFLPAADFYSDDRQRGDGASYPAPSPVCFAREQAAAAPAETAGWVGALLLAVAVPLVRTRRRRAD